jgi:hypothetical protein
MSGFAGQSDPMKAHRVSHIAANSGPTCRDNLRIHWLRLLSVTMLSVSVVLPPSLAQSQDPTIAALKRGESAYFTAKMENLSSQLNLSQSQQTRLRPIAEQETAYIEQIRRNPVLSIKDKFNRLQGIIRESDKQMKTFLSAEQWKKLQSLRTEQKAVLDNYVNSQ